MLSRNVSYLLCKTEIQLLGLKTTRTVHRHWETKVGQCSFVNIFVPKSTVHGMFVQYSLVPRENGDICKLFWYDNRR